MQSYYDVTNFIHEKLQQLSSEQQADFIKNLIYHFVKGLPTDWLEGELDSEKPHYQAIIQQILQPNWHDEIIEQQLLVLDDIMFSMGDAYPHNTSEALLMIWELLDFYLSLREMAQKSDNSHELGMLSAISYLEYVESLIENNLGQASDFEDWLAQPLMATAFDDIKHALTLAQKI
ncbi:MULTISPECIES: hypothetical protein [unclassified Moraxella]|uniref:hypothetical protein n=1 Tax=unclassified Moraxella TaxID=2685852 RepID=UPI003AF5BCC8